MRSIVRTCAAFGRRAPLGLAILWLGCGTSTTETPRNLDAGTTGRGVSDADASDVYLIPPTWSGQAASVLSTADQAIAVAVDSSHVYWQNPGGAIYGCPLGGCSGGNGTLLSSLIGPSSAPLTSLSASGGVAIFLTQTGFAISTVPFSSPGVTSTTYTEPNTSAGTGVSALTTDGSRIYFMSTITVDGGFDQALDSCPIQGPCASPRAILTSNVDYFSMNSYASLGRFAIADGEAYFVELPSTGANALRAVPLTGGASRTVCGSGATSTLTAVESLVVAGGYAYFTTGENPGSIYQCATTGVSAPKLYIHDYAPYALATDGENLYWTNYVGTTGTVATCALGAKCTSPFTVASSQDSPFAIAATASAVYWSTTTSIMTASR